MIRTLTAAAALAATLVLTGCAEERAYMEPREPILAPEREAPIYGEREGEGSLGEREGVIGEREGELGEREGVIGEGLEHGD
ncbi:MAG: hypothetical protein ACK47B_19855 [Armatimonadota bacterium]